MTSFGDLITEVKGNLLGAALGQEQQTVLSALWPTGVPLPLEDARLVSIGLIEVGEELMWVTSVDENSNTCVIGQKGLYGSERTGHFSGEVVTNNPKYPTIQIKRAINNTVLDLYPEIWSVFTTSLMFNAAQSTYELPTGTREVLNVSWQSVGPSGAWPAISRYRFDPNANTTAFPSGKSLTLFEAPIPGRSVQVTYTSDPVVFDASDDTLSSVGLQESCKEALVYGACSRLVGYTEPARIADDSASAQFMDPDPAGKMLTASQFYYSMYLRAKQAEGRRLRDRYQPRPHFER